jgi:hypothetical protein
MSSVNSDEYGADEFDRDLAAGQPVELVVNVKRVPRGPTPLYTVSSGRGSRVANAALKSSTSREVFSGFRTPATANL